MKKILSLFLAAMILSLSVASSVPGTPGSEKKPLKASDIMIPVSSTGKKISLKELATISKSDLEKLTGRKMNVMEKLAFKKTQKRLSKGIDENGYITDKKLTKAFFQNSDGSSGFHLGGFALGFLLGLIGILIAYVAFKDENKQNRVKWAWLGLAAGVIISLILILAVLA